MFVELSVFSAATFRPSDMKPSILYIPGATSGLIWYYSGKL